jgi:hypothetical protein
MNLSPHDRQRSDKATRRTAHAIDHRAGKISETLSRAELSPAFRDDRTETGPNSARDSSVAAVSDPPMDGFAVANRRNGSSLIDIAARALARSYKKPKRKYDPANRKSKIGDQK